MNDNFSKAPLFVLLPEKTALKDLNNFLSSYYARYESIKASNSENSNPDEQAVAEEKMLRQILDWLSLYNEAQKQKSDYER